MTTFQIETVFDKKTQSMTWDEARELFYESHSCDTDDSDRENARIERFIENSGIEIID